MRCLSTRTSIFSAWFSRASCFLSLVFLLPLTPSAKGQHDFGVVPFSGHNPSDVYQPGDIDSVDAVSGAVLIHIPILSVPQKGTLALGFSIRSNGVGWTMVEECNDPNLPCAYRYDTTFGRLMPLPFTALVWDQSTSVSSQLTEVFRYEANSGGSRVYDPVVNLVDGSGSIHPMAFDAKDHTRLMAADGSKFMYKTSTPLVNGVGMTTGVSSRGLTWGYDPGTVFESNGIAHKQMVWTDDNGNVTQSSNTRGTEYVVDPNGNTITRRVGISAQATIGTFTDTIHGPFYDPTLDGPPAAAAPVSSCPQTGRSPLQVLASAKYWQAPASQDLGGTAQYLLCYATIHLRTGFFGTSGDQYHLEYEGDATVLDSIVLPDGNSWAFLYSSADPNDASTKSYGELVKVQRPAGGSTTYTYRTAFTCRGQTRVVSSRTINDGQGNSAEWTYEIGSTSNPDGRSIIHSPAVANPAGNSTTSVNDTVITSYGVFLPSTLPSCANSKQIADTYQGNKDTGTLLRSVETRYRYNYSPTGIGTMVTVQAVLPESVRTTIPGAGTSVTTQVYGPSLNITQPQLDSSGWHFSQPISIPLGVMTSTDTYDYDGSTLLSSTIMTPYGESNPTYYEANMLDLPGSIVVSGSSNGSSTTFVYDEDNGSPSGVKGNQTSVKRWLDTTGDYLTSHTVYNTSGLPTKTTDARGNSTSYTYDPSGAFVHDVQRGPLHDVFTFDFYTGALRTHTDSNGLTTSNKYADPLSRLTKTIEAGGSQQESWEVLQYPNATTTTIAKDQKQTGDGVLQATIYTDGLGRSIKEVSPSGSITDTVYDAMGRFASKSNPYYSTVDPTYGVTSFSYDALGRQTLQKNPDGSSQSTSYSGNTVEFSDEAGKHRAVSLDALSRTISVLEADSLRTNYSYDSLGNLEVVDQKGTAAETRRTRMFKYDSLSRLLWSVNPETGVLCYGEGDGTVPGCRGNGYDSAGNLIHKTDARGVEVTYSYDALNRLTRKDYSDGTSPVAFGYDGKDEGGNSVFGSTHAIGRLSRISNLSPVYMGFGYDLMGRTTETSYCFPSLCDERLNAAHATYDLAGDIVSMSYPDGYTLNEAYDAGGRLQSVYPAGAAADSGYVKSVDYWPNGAPKNIYYGNGVNEQLAMNNRLQPCEHSAFLPPFTGGSLAFDQQYMFSTSTSVPCGNEPNNNGNMYRIANGVNPAQGSNTFTQNLGYDKLNRLTAWSVARMGGQSRSMSFSYDSFGNMASDTMYSPNFRTAPNATGTSGSRSFANAAYDSSLWPYNSQNRLIDATFDCTGAGTASHYDAAGNQLCSGSSTDTDAEQYLWDAESHLRQVNAQHNGNTYDFAALYTYDASGQRVRADYTDPHTTNATPNFREYSYFNGQLIAEKDQTGAWLDHVYAFGRKIARIEPLDVRAHLSGIRPSSGPWGVYVLGSQYNYLIKTGDRIAFRMYQHNAAAGISLGYSDGSNSDNYCTADTQGVCIGVQNQSDVWVNRVADLSYAANKILQYIFLEDREWGPPGSYDVMVADMVILSADGTITPFLGRDSFESISGDGNTYRCGAVGANWHTDCRTERVTGNALGGGSTTTYMLADQVGTTSLELTAGGWPVWRGEFAPFGQELSSITTSNRYKFTGKERDTESGLDYFGARYYASNTGRFVSPDWSLKPEPVPYSKLEEPQSLNLYAYGLNNPITQADADGHCAGAGVGMTTSPGGCAGTSTTAAPNSDPSSGCWDAMCEVFAAEATFSGQEKAQMAQQNNASNTSVVLPTGKDLTMVQTLMGEQTGQAALGTNQYGDDQAGRKAGPPTGAQITNAILDKEANLMAGTMLNLGHIGNAKTYLGLPAGKHLTALAAKAKPGSALAIQLQRDISAVKNATPSPYSQWRAVNQGFIRSRGDALRVAGTDFIH